MQSFRHPKARTPNPVDIAEAQLLFVDDDRSFLNFLNRSLEKTGCEILTASSWEEAESLIEKRLVQPEIVFVEPLLNGRSAGDLIRDICAKLDPVPVVVLSALREPRAIVDVIRGGAFDVLCKPFLPGELQNLIQSVLGRKRPAVIPAARSAQNLKTELIHCSAGMKVIQETILQIADALVPVLLLGESGVGKDIIARLIHEHSRLSGKPFVKVNCAAMPAELVESELFGCEKGAFTGAYIDRPGKFEFANGGTIFLDEIAEFPASAQAKLLQVLQDGRFTRLGSNEEVEVIVRVIAATNKRLEDAIEKGSFREDLYYRLNVVNIEIPPLRRRRDDIELLIQHFFGRLSSQYNPKAIPFPQDIMTLFNSYGWPGNVRELENLVKRYVVLQDADSIRRELDSKLSRQKFEELEELSESCFQDGAERLDLKEITRKAAVIVERSLILKSLNRHNWNRSKVAKELRVSYKTLLTKIDQYDIKP